MGSQYSLSLMETKFGSCYLRSVLLKSMDPIRQLTLVPPLRDFEF